MLVCLLQLQAAGSNTSEKINSPVQNEELALERDYETFKRHVISNGMKATDCTSEIKQRKINMKSCKETHRFIIATEKEVLDICSDQGKYLNKGHLTRSERDFPVIICKLGKKAKKGQCQYTGQKLTKKIDVSCKTLPVHYQDDILTFEG